MSVELRQVREVKQVRFKGPGSVKIRQTDKEESLTVHAPAYVIRHIVSSVEDGILNLGYVSPQVFSLKVLKEVISYDLKLKQLDALSVSGSGRVLVPDLDVDKLALSLSGSGKIQFEHMTADLLSVNGSGSGSIIVQGDVETQRVNLSGSGDYQALRLVSDICHINLTGSGGASVLVHDEMIVRLSGSGDIRYKGYPDIQQQITGTGRVKRIRRPVDKGFNHPSGEDRA